MTLIHASRDAGWEWTRLPHRISGSTVSGKVAGMAPETAANEASADCSPDHDAPVTMLRGT